MGKIKRADLDLIRCFAIIFVISVHGLSYVGFYKLSNPSITYETIIRVAPWMVGKKKVDE